MMDDQKELGYLLYVLRKQMVYTKPPTTKPSDNCCTNFHDKDRWLGYWLFAILHCLQMPCSKHVLNTLRDITHICIKIRTYLPKDKSDMACYYNMFIHFIVMYFKQTDLLNYL